MNEQDFTVRPEIGRKIRLIVTERNRGYGTACNIGARATDAPLLLFLNDDTYLKESCLAELHRFMSVEERVLLQPIIYHEYAGQVRAGNPCDIFGAAGLGVYGNCGTGEFFASGACLAVSKVDYHSLGGFDEKLFLYYDDVDLSWRARLMGLKVSAVRTTLCVHAGAGSSAVMPHMVKFYLTQRNRLRVMIKNYSTLRTITRCPIAIFFTIGGAFFFAIRTRLCGYMNYGMRALAWNLIVLRSTLRDRYSVQERRVLEDKAIEKAMCKTSMDTCVLKRYITTLQ